MPEVLSAKCGFCLKKFIPTETRQVYCSDRCKSDDVRFLNTQPPYVQPEVSKSFGHFEGREDITINTLTSAFTQAACERREKARELDAGEITPLETEPSPKRNPFLFGDMC